MPFIVFRIAALTSFSDSVSCIIFSFSEGPVTNLSRGSNHSVYRAGGAGPTTPTLVNQKSCHLWSKACIFKALVGPIIVSLSLLSNGQTNLALLSPPLVYTQDNTAKTLWGCPRKSFSVLNCNNSRNIGPKTSV